MLSSPMRKGKANDFGNQRGIQRSSTVRVLACTILLLVGGQVLLNWRIICKVAAPVVSLSTTMIPAPGSTFSNVARALQPEALVPPKHSRNRLALVLPFVDWQGNKLQEMLQRWSQERYLPCTGTLLPATVYFYSPLGESTLAQTGELRSMWNSVGDKARSCFMGGAVELYARLPQSEALAHPDGTCGQFYKLFQELRGKAEYFFLMEPDALPIRAGWLDRLVAETHAPPCSSFWIKGSAQQCDSAYGSQLANRDLHINGGALYCISNDTIDFMQRVQDFLPAYTEAKVQTAGCAFGGFDHSMYKFIRHQFNFEYTKRHALSKYQYTEALVNMCEDEYSEEAFKVLHPGAYVVHSKAPFFNATETAVRRLVWSILGRYPDKKTEQSKAVRWVERLGDDHGMHKMTSEVCCSAEYINLISQGKHSDVCTNHCLKDSVMMARCPTPCSSALERLAWQWTLPDHQDYYVWSSDFHVGPIGCLEPLLQSIGAKVHSEIDFNNCIWKMHTCRKRLKVLQFDDWRGVSLDPCPNTMRRAYFEAYKEDEEFRRVDLFICSHPAANCELYLPFNRSVLVYATT